MKTSIEFVNHASVIISGANVSILSDPWYEGSAFHKGWNLLYDTPQDEIINILEKITHIWISHEHPDHFSILFFQKYAWKIKEKKIKILFQTTKDERVISFIRKLSIEVIELKHCVPINLDNDFSITCIKDGFYDSALLVTNFGENILNKHDCNLNNKNMQKIYSMTGSLDALLTQFSYAAWKGGIENKQWRHEAASEKLIAIKNQIATLKPKIIIPFASYIYFSNKENFYLNDSINKPINILNGFKNNYYDDILILKPNDIVGGVSENYSSENAIKFWDKYYNKIKIQDNNEYLSVHLDDLKNNFSKYCDRIRSKNNLKFMRAIRQLSFGSLMSPTIVGVNDLNLNIEFDYLLKRISITDKMPLICMHSESLNFIFNNSFGFDTLTVNGCFEEGQKGGFVKAAKSLAIENLNNLGIYMKPNIIFNLDVIFLFISLLYKISKKMMISNR